MFALCGWWIAAESARAISLETQSNAVTSSRITIDADRSDWQGIPEYTLDTDSTPPGPELDFDAVQFANDATNVYFRLRLLPSPSGTPQPYGFRHNLFLDTDQDRTTGFVGGGNFLATGADYLVQGPAVYSFGGATPEEFTWNFLQDLGANDTPDTDIEVSIPIAVIGSPDQFDFFFNGANEGFIAEDFYPEFANSPLGDFFTYDLADVGPPPGITGDYNGNGRVEQADLDLVLLNWGQTGVPGGWFNDLPQGTIDQAELDGVLLNWGDTSAPVSAPESTSLVLLAIGCAGAWCVVRWRAIRTVGCSCREQP
jgi:hypothetical protein